MTLKYLIVDDEPFARKLMQSHAGKVEVLEEAGVCSSAVEAANFLRKQKVDIIFLDIQMPELTGLDFIKTLRQPPAIVLTTAYREFAADAFDLDVIDYLVKPISFERFLKAVEKIVSITTVNKKEHLVETEPSILIKSDRKVFPINLNDILYIESLDNYVKVHLQGRVLITHEGITSFEQRLPTDLFVRIHRSFIIQRKHIQSVSAESIQLAGKELPFGRAFKQRAMNLLRLQQ